LAGLSTDLRRLRAVGTVDRQGKIQPPRYDRLKTWLLDEPKNKTADSVPVLVQMLQAEDEPGRMILVKVLGSIDDKAATQALGQRALYDLSPDIRYQAIQELKKRPRDQYRQLLLDGLRYPLPAVAQHAAEALVELQDRDALTALAHLAKEPDPAAPF